MLSIAYKETIGRILLLSIYFIFIVLTTSSCTDDNVQKQMEPFREMEPLLEDAINEPLATLESLAATPIFNVDPLRTPENQPNPTTPGSEVDFSEAKIIDIVETIPSQFEVVEISKIPARNCSGPNTIHISESLQRTTTQEVNHGTNVSGGVSYVIVAALELEYSITTGEEIAKVVEFEVEAKPGTNLEYPIAWKEVWTEGYVVVENADGSQQEVPFSVKRSLRGEILDAEDLGCQ